MSNLEMKVNAITQVLLSADSDTYDAAISGVGYRYKKGTVLKATDRNLDQQTGTKNPKAGPFWDRRLMADEADVIASEVQAYVRSNK